MAIADDAVSTNGVDFNAPTVSCAITVGSITNGILVIFVSRVNTFGITLGTPTVGGSTTGVTLLGQSHDLSGDLLNVIDVYYKLAPGAGASTVAAAASGGNPALFAISAASYSGVAQTSTFGTPATAGGVAGENPTVNVSTSAGNVVIDALSFNASNSTMAVGAGQAQRINNAAGESAGIAVSTETASGGTTTMSWTRTGGSEWAILAAVMNAAGSGAYTLTPVDAGSYTLTGAVVGVTFDSATTWLRVGR